MSTDLLKAIAVTAELCGREFSDGAAKQFVRDLQGYPVAQVLRALDRCRRELSRPLTLAAVIERIDDGRPGPDEAWAMLPRDEDTTTVWTTEMAEAWGIVRDLDATAGRFAFREAYSRIIAAARAERRPPKWQASLGWDKASRESVLRRAVELGRLSEEHVAKLLPYHEPTPAAMLVLAKGAQMLEDKRAGREPIPDNIRAMFLQKTE